MEKAEDKCAAGVNFEPEVLAKLDDLAAAHRRSRSQMINELLKLSMGMPSIMSIAHMDEDGNE